MIDLTLNAESYRPGEELSGYASWLFEKVPKKLDIRLFWYTQGKGTEDALIVKSIPVDPLSRQGSQEFRFPLPKAPYSFSGRLISLIWAVEIIAEPSWESARKELLLSPSGEEIILLKGNYES